MASRQPPQKKQKTETAQPDESSLREEYEKLEDVHERLEKLNEEAADEIIQIEKKYNAKRNPLYKERNDVIKKIPGFWKKAFLNHDVLCDILSENDQKVFDYVTELLVEDFEDVAKQGYKIIFKFKTNPWFKNDTLFKEFSIEGEEGELKVNTSNIDWKGGADPFASSEPQSFFSMWFKPLEEDESDEIAEIIKEDIWPDPAKFYHGMELGEEEGAEEGQDE